MEDNYEEILSSDPFEEEQKHIHRAQIESMTGFEDINCLMFEEVESKIYGKGKIVFIHDEYKIIEVMFKNGGNRSFSVPTAFEKGLKFVDKATQKKIEKLLKKEKKFLENYKPSHKYDPVEDTKYYKSIEEELDKLIRENIGDGGHIGYCHLYWAEKKRILKTKYGIEWKCPSELNPQILFD